MKKTIRAILNGKKAGNPESKNHVAANLLLVTLLLSGLFSLSSKIPLEVFPSFETDMHRYN